MVWNITASLLMGISNAPQSVSNMYVFEIRFWI